MIRYVDTGVEYLGQVPDTWEVVPAKSLFLESKEKRHANDERLTPSQKFGVVSQVEYMRLVGGNIVLADKGLDDWKHVEPSDYIISLRSFQGGLEMSRVTGCVTWHYIVLRPRQAIHPDYYKHLFKCDGYIAELNSTCQYLRDGQDLRYSNFVQVPLPVPPIDEQRAIAAYLDKACVDIDRAIDAAESSIEHYMNYRKSTIDVATTRGASGSRSLIASDIDWLGEMPKTWKVATIGAIAAEAAAEPNEDVPYIGLENVESFTSHFVGEFSSVADMGDSVSYFDSDAVLLSKLRPYLAKACHPGFDGAASSEMLVLKTIPSISQRWFVYLLLNYRLVDQLNADTAGVRMPRTSWKAVKRHLIPVPSFEEQIAIADYLDEKCARIDTAIAAKRSIVDELKAYKKSLVYEYVTGKREVPCQ